MQSPLTANYKTHGTALKSVCLYSVSVISQIPELIHKPTICRPICYKKTFRPTSIKYSVTNWKVRSKAH